MGMNDGTQPYTVAAKKSLGQHFLTSDIVPGWMCDAAHIEKGDIVLEIGPGTGVLTNELLRRGAVVHAIETDERSVTILNDRFADEITQAQLHIYVGDIRDGIPTECSQRPYTYKVVSNIPYYLTGALFRLFLERDDQPSDLVFLVQKEIAQRIVKDEKYSLLSLATRVFGTPKYVRTVTRGHFHPPPNVDSAIIHIADIGHHYIAPENISDFFRVLKAGFAHKRKYTVSNLSTIYPKAIVQEIFSTLDISVTERSENITLEQWVAIYSALPPLP